MAPQPVAPANPSYVLTLDATFGNARLAANVRTKSDLDNLAYYRYIYGDGTTTGDGTDGLYGNYWSRHRDYPEGDPKSLHVFTPNTLILKARVPAGNTPTEGQIESGILRFKTPVTPRASYIECRARHPSALGGWAAFWLNPGVQYPTTPPTFSSRHWPPEIDIFDQFGYNGVPLGHLLFSAVGTNGNPAAYGNPHDTFNAPGTTGQGYPTTFDMTKALHTYGLDWNGNVLSYYLDGIMVRQTYYEWNSEEPAHLLCSNQIGAKFNDLTGLIDAGPGWDYELDYIRVWKRNPPIVLTDLQRQRIGSMFGTWLAAELPIISS